MPEAQKTPDDNQPTVKKRFIFQGGSLTLPQPTVLMKWLDEANSENSHLKHLLSQATEENRSLLLDVRRSQKASTSRPFQMDRPLTLRTF